MKLNGNWTILRRFAAFALQQQMNCRFRFEKRPELRMLVEVQEQEKEKDERERKKKHDISSFFSLVVFIGY